MTTEAEAGADLSAVDDHMLPDNFGEEPEEQQQEPEETGEDAPAETDEPEAPAEQPKPKARSANDRIAELTRDKHEVRRRADAAEARVRELESQAQPQPQQEQALEDVEPSPDDFDFGEADPAYVKALGAYAARQEFARLQKGRDEQDQIRSVAQTFQQREAAFAKDNPDYAEKISSKDLAISPQMARAIAVAEDGPAIAYHLASNPDEARRIAGITDPFALGTEMGAIRAQLANPPAAQPTKTVSDAPAPAPTTRGQGGRYQVDPATQDFTAFDKAYGN